MPTFKRSPAKLPVSAIYVQRLVVPDTVQNPLMGRAGILKLTRCGWDYLPIGVIPPILVFDE